MEQDSASKIHTLEVQVKNLSDKLDKLDSEKYTTTNHDIIYLKEVVEFQNAKLEKLTNLINDFLKGDNSNLLLSSIQDNDVNVNDQVNQVQDQVEQQVRQHVAHHPNQHQTHHSSHHQTHQHLNNYKPTDELQALDTNIHPELHVAQPAVTNSGPGSTHLAAGPHDLSDFGKSKVLKRKDIMMSSNGSPNELKRPKIIIDFIHNPMTVKEIYDEFTKGFRGQPALCDLDEKYGKNQWRGDSRSKESKRYQRRKRLCDAIKKGMVKYEKTADEIISYIEEFRGDKSLTWVMNGNLPEDLLL